MTPKMGNIQPTNPLELRKQILVAESERNRSQLVGDIEVLTTDVRELSNRAKSLGPIASAATLLVTGMAAFKRGKPAEPTAKRSWLQTILKGAGLVSTLWLAFRPPSDHSKDK